MRRRYLDWLRGLAVLIMIEAHTIDSWTRAADRSRKAFAWGLVVGGFGAPMFLFLAGVALPLAAGSRLRKGLSIDAVAARARARGWQIFGLAFLFRLQSWLISGGAPTRTLLKVDILNIMGPSMVAAAILWRAGRENRTRAFLFAAAACATAMLTPIVRASTWVAALPDPIEWYVRPSPGHTTFTIFPWTAFLFTGAVVGFVLDAAREQASEQRVNLALGAVGVAIALAGYGASFLPSIYQASEFWTSSPTFFFLRLGILIGIVPVAYVWDRTGTGRWRDWSPIAEMGVASLFVYWIHVEMVYGVASTAIHRRLSLEQWSVAFFVFTLFLFAVVRLKNRLTRLPFPRPARRASETAA